MEIMSTSTAVRMAPLPQPKRAADAVRFTRDAVARMAQIGILPEKYELLDGEIVRKTGQGIAHRRGVSLLMAWLIEVFGAEFVQTQAPIDVSPEDNPTNAPEPDLCVLSRPLGSFSTNPGPEAIVLVVEVGDKTLSDDLSKKADLYARAGIPEYWVLDVQNQRLHLHRTPIHGTYRSVTSKSAPAEVASLSQPERGLPLAGLFA